MEEGMLSQRIGIVGPGAMGLLHAAYLTQGGLPVIVVDHRRGRAQRLRQGFQVVPSGADHAPSIETHLTCRPARNLKPPFDLLIFTVKAFATGTAAAEAAHLIGSRTVLMSLQNGLGNIEALQQYQRPELILAAVTTSGATLFKENLVIERGLGTISLGSVAGNHDLARDVAALLAGAGLPAEPIEDIWPVIWRKLAVNSAINPLTAMLDIENGLLLEAPVAEFAGQVALETGTVARACGVNLDPALLPEAVAEVCRLTADNVSSMLQDVRAGRQTELDEINGAVVREAEKVGAAAPLNMALVALLRAYEWRRQWAEQERERKQAARREHRREMRAQPDQESDE
jgi:2-dehydropantoate 2-reductase